MKKILSVFSVLFLFVLFSCENGKTPDNNKPPAPPVEKEKFEITLSAVENGNITVKSGEKTLNQEELKAVEKGRHLAFILKSEGKAKVRTLIIDGTRYENVENAQITATVEVQKAFSVSGVVDKIFTVTIKAVENGKIEALEGVTPLTAEQLKEVRDGTNLKFKLTPKDCYKAKSLKLGNDTYTNEDENALILEKNLVITKDIEVSGTVEENKSSNEYEVEENGTKVTFNMVELPEASNVTLGGDYKYEAVTVDNKNNKPHTLSISPFYLCTTEVTQELYQIIMGANPSKFKTDPDNNEIQEKRPVEQVKWYEAIAFCNKLTLKVDKLKDEIVYYSDAEMKVPYTEENATNKATVYANWGKKGFRLPTDCEWEWAAMGGQSYKFAGSDEIDKVAWWKENSNKKTHEVAKKVANAYGLYDMTGNVGEWCWDWFLPYTKDAVLEKDYKGPEANSSLKKKAYRPGAYFFTAKYCYNLERGQGTPPTVGVPSVGFRIAKSK